MTRTRTANKATETAPAKKTTAKRTPPKPRAPRTRTPRKTTAPALSLVKDQPPQDQPEPAATIVDFRHPLKVRRRLFVGPMGPGEQAAIRAALDSARLQLPIPVRTWNGSQAQLADGTLLIHNPGPDRVFTAHIACRRGAIHGYPITSHQDLKAARAITHACERRHTANTPGDDGLEYDWHKAAGHGAQPTNRLSDGLKAAKKAAADTQPLSKQDIADGLAARAADTETPKGHPEP